MTTEYAGMYELTPKRGDVIEIDRHDIEMFAAINDLMPGSWCVRVTDLRKGKTIGDK